MKKSDLFSHEKSKRYKKMSSNNSKPPSPPPEEPPPIIPFPLPEPAVPPTETPPVPITEYVPIKDYLCEDEKVVRVFNTKPFRVFTTNLRVFLYKKSPGLKQVVEIGHKHIAGTELVTHIPLKWFVSAGIVVVIAGLYYTTDYFGIAALLSPFIVLWQLLLLISAVVALAGFFQIKSMFAVFADGPMPPYLIEARGFAGLEEFLQLIRIYDRKY